MTTIKDVLIGAKKLIEQTNWSPGPYYALKNGKVFHDLLRGGLADSYCINGALMKSAHDCYLQSYELNYENKKLHNSLAYNAGQLILRNEKFKRCLAEWNDQDPEADKLNEFVQELKVNNTPRDQAKIKINAFKAELKKMCIKPIMSKEKVLAAIDCAIMAVDND